MHHLCSLVFIAFTEFGLTRPFAASNTESKRLSNRHDLSECLSIIWNLEWPPNGALDQNSSLNIWKLEFQTMESMDHFRPFWIANQRYSSIIKLRRRIPSYCRFKAIKIFLLVTAWKAHLKEISLKEIPFECKISINHWLITRRLRPVWETSCGILWALVRCSNFRTAIVWADFDVCLLDTV